MPDINDPNPYPGVYRLKLPLAHSPLKYVNAYLLPSPSGHLLVDTGWNTEDTRIALDEQLKAQGLAAADITRIVITHAHVDHYGLAAGLMRDAKARLGMHAVEAQMCELRYQRTRQFSLATNALLRTSGAAERHVPDPEEMVARFGRLAAYAAPDQLFQEGDTLAHGPFYFRIFWTPGHSPGHICLYEPAHKLFFSGDHVLPGITSHIGLSPQSGPNPLGQYSASLNRLRHLDVALMLPAHGPPIKGFTSRVRQILLHHEKRTAQMLAVLATARADGLSAFALVNAMTWRAAGRPVAWERLRDFDQRLAITEAMAHLEALAAEGRLIKQMRASVGYYRLG
jgi:glyoxylase-like metal-dependent hydrolase (beta-lactamase superfamily II)